MADGDLEIAVTPLCILYVASFAEPSWSTAAMVARALERAGHHVARVEEHEHTATAILHRAAAVRPDVLLFHKLTLRDGGEWPSNADAVCSTLQSLRPYCRQIVGWNFEWLYQDIQPARWQWARAVSECVDVSATTDGGAATSLPNGFTLRQGIPDDVDHECEWAPPIVGDVLFLGGAYGAREGMVAAFKAAFGDRFAHVCDVRGKALTRLVRSYRLCIGANWPHLDGYWSNRIYVVTGHGGLFVGPTVAGMEHEGWKSSENYFAAGPDAAPMVERCRQLLSEHPERLEWARRQGFALAYRATYDARVAELIAHLRDT